MATHRKNVIVDAAGTRARIREYVVDDKGTAAVIIELRSGRRLAVPANLLHVHEGGGYEIERRFSEFGGSRGLEVPVVAEKVSVGKRTVERDRLRIRRRVVTEERTIETPLVQEHLVIERVAHGGFIDRMPDPRREGETLIIPCVEEVAVVEKRLRLREELHVRVVREHVTDRRTIPIRRHELEIEHETNKPKK